MAYKKKLKMSSENILIERKLGGKNKLKQNKKQF